MPRILSKSIRMEIPLPNIERKTHTFTLRAATLSDILAINKMIAYSVRTLHSDLYDRDVVESAIKYVYKIDPASISTDGDEHHGGEEKGAEDGKEVKKGRAWVIVASPVVVVDDRRRAESAKGQEIVAVAAILFPSCSSQPADAKENKEEANLKALYTHPSYTRLGLASIILSHCESEARSAGYGTLEFGATYAGVKFYHKAGYKVLTDREGNPGGPGGKGRCDRVMDDGRVLELVFMGREL